MRVCPKCKSINYQIVELWKGHALIWSPLLSRSYDDTLMDVGDPYKVYGECLDCGYTWTFRGITRVSEELILEFLNAHKNK